MFKTGFNMDAKNVRCLVGTRSGTLLLHPLDSTHIKSRG